MARPARRAISAASSVSEPSISAVRRARPRPPPIAPARAARSRSTRARRHVLPPRCSPSPRLARTSSTASAGAADRPQRVNTGRSSRSSPMYDTASSVTLASLRIWSNAVDLLATPCWTMRTASWAARCAVAPDDREDSRPTGRPARWAQTIAAPSLMWKPLDSLPSACIITMPSVSTPSTSKSSSLMRRARSSTVMFSLVVAIRPSVSARDRAGARHPRRNPPRRRRRPT